MSLKANPNKTRDPLDRFYTNDRLAQEIVNEGRRLAPHARRFLEPSSGGGAFLRAIHKAYLIGSREQGWLVQAVDVDPGAFGPAHDLGAVFFNRPWLDWMPEGQVDFIAMNPPFAEPPPPGKTKGKTIVTPHVKKALEQLAVGGVCCCLVRQSFLATKERAELFALYRPLKVVILVERPSFTSDGHTDQHEYCVVYWQRESETVFSTRETTLGWIQWK